MLLKSLLIIIFHVDILIVADTNLFKTYERSTIYMFNGLECLIKKEFTNDSYLLITKNDQVIYEKNFNIGSRYNTTRIYSVTKTIVCLLIGKLIDNDKLKNENVFIKFF